MGVKLRIFLVAAIVVAGSVQVAVAFSRSLIPFEIDGTLHAVDTVGDSKGRLHTLTVDGRTYEVDNRRLADLRPGRQLHKDAWSATLVADGRKEHRLPVGDETFQFAALTLLTAGAAWFLTGRRPTTDRAAS